MQDGAPSQVLVVALPRRHLGPAERICRERGRVTIPAGSPGDLDRTAPGTEVLVIVTGEDEVAAASWGASFVRRVAPAEGPLPEGLPPTWVDDHGASALSAAPGDPDPDPDDDEEEDDEDRVGPQAFFEVRALEELPKHDWVFANELVRKQDRGGRAFLPRAPRLIRRPA